MTSEKSLVFDVGNTRVNWGVVFDGQILRSGGRSQDELREKGFDTFLRRLPRDVDRVLVSSVGEQAFVKRLATAIRIHSRVDVHFAKSESAAFGVINGYAQPRRLGVDRWVGMIGARAEFRGAILVVDAGTAVTIDALANDGRHLGGQIIAGLGPMIDVLNEKTHGIATKSGKFSTPIAGMDLFARNTRGAVQNGSLAAVCGAIGLSVKTMRGAGYRPKVVLTGGDASRILKQLEGNPIHRPNLVLQGLAYMLSCES